jgi:carboxyl-terminal processing protease
MRPNAFKYLSAVQRFTSPEPNVMYRTPLLFSLILFTHFSFAQFPVSPDSVYQVIKTNSVFREKANWPAIEQEFRGGLSSATTIKDTMRAFVNVFKQLADPHSAIFLNNGYYGYYKQYDSITQKRLQPVYERSQKEMGKIKTVLLKGKYAYISIPGIQAWGNEIDQYSQAINDSVCSFRSKDVKGFIIDLRLNGGGTLFPMISGVSALLGHGVVGGYTDSIGKVYSKWELVHNNFSQGGQSLTNIKRGCSADFSKVPVVVLLGPITMSSGSMTAIAFKGRPKTLFIGEPTADGYTTATNWYIMHETLTLKLSTNYVADRNGMVYKTTVDPDLKITSPDNFDDLLNDEKIKAALQRLR